MGTKILTRSEIFDILTERDGFSCFLCKKPFEVDGTRTKEGEQITVDHWIPLSKGGTWDINNLRLMSKRCNAIKGNRIPSADGTLPEPVRASTFKTRAQKRSVRPVLCTRCTNGRSLGPEEFCDDCGSIPMPFRHPQWAKLSPNDCEHEGIWWCWVCMSGIVDRKPAIYDVLRSDDDSEF